MGKINGCLKCIFIFFNVLFVLQGCGLIFLVAKLQTLCFLYNIQLSAVGIPSFGWFWLFSIGVLTVSSLGIFAACCERERALKIFAGLMGIGMIVMIVVGITVVVKRNQMKAAFLSTSSDVVQPYMRTPGITHMLEALQTYFKCCGIGSADDWGNEIPESCQCNSSSSSECKSKPPRTSGPAKIYKMACGEHVFGFLDFIFRFILTIVFIYAVTALMGLLITICMIRQIIRHDADESIAMDTK